MELQPHAQGGIEVTVSGIPAQAFLLHCRNTCLNAPHSQATRGRARRSLVVSAMIVHRIPQLHEHRSGWMSQPGSRSGNSGSCPGEIAGVRINVPFQLLTVDRQCRWPIPPRLRRLRLWAALHRSWRHQRHLAGSSQIHTLQALLARRLPWRLPPMPAVSERFSLQHHYRVAAGFHRAAVLCRMRHRGRRHRSVEVTRASHRCGMHGLLSEGVSGICSRIAACDRPTAFIVHGLVPKARKSEERHAVWRSSPGQPMAMAGLDGVRQTGW